MKKHRLLPLFLCAALAAMLLAGCGSAPAEDTEAAEATETTEAAASGEGLKIAIVSSPSGVDDGSFNQNNYQGILDFISENPDATVTPVQETTGDSGAAINAVQDIVADYDVILCCGFQFAGITQIAQDNPDVDFILVDAYPSDAEGNDIEVDNVYAMQFKEQESGFLAGVAAALSTQTGKVAVVNGIAYPSNVNYQYGFMGGVNYANRHLDTAAEIVELSSYAGTDVTGANVGGNYIGSFADQANGKVVGQALINEGCDVDQYDDGANGGSNIILTSVLKVMDANDSRVLTEIQNGEFAGGNYLLGADTDSTGYVSDPDRCQLSEEAIAALDQVYALVKDGTIVPPANFNEMTPDNFTGLDAE